VQVKIDARVPMPEELDLRPYKGTGLQPGEVLIPEEASASVGEGSSEAAVDQEVLGQLVSMGFSENGSKRAIMATACNDPEVAMNWIMEHMEDPDFNDPLPVGGTDGGEEVSEASVSMIESMGYSREQAKGALLACDRNLERALDWIFSRDDLDQAVAEILSSNSGASATATAGSTGDEEVDDGEGLYTLVAIISHIGKNTDHGHYVCHIKKEGHWVFYNDEKVAKSKAPPLDLGFMYLYKRNV